MKRFVWFSLILAHTFLLIVVSYFWLQLPYTYDNEASLISLTATIKNIALGLEDKPDRENFLFINTSYEKSLAPKLDEYGFIIGNEAITNRESLTRFFAIAAARNHHAFIFCDIFLRDSTEYDSLLQMKINSAGNILFPYHRENNNFIMPVIKVHSALSDYQSDFGNFVKYEYLQHDTCKSVAHEMFAALYGKTLRKQGFFYFNGTQPVLNSIIIDFPIRQFDVFREDTLGYNSIHLGDFLSLPEANAADMLKGKIVIIGDFLENDMHETLYGATAGPLIHLNAFLNLEDKRNQPGFFFLLYLFVIYFAFSVSLFSPGRKFSFTWLERIQDSRYGGVIVDYLKYAFFLLAMSVVSYLIFGIHLNILIISLYISLIENLIEFVYTRYFQNIKPETYV
jgi:hypothetical protein